jgi:hypothetical protein
MTAGKAKLGGGRKAGFNYPEIGTIHPAGLSSSSFYFGNTVIGRTTKEDEAISFPEGNGSLCSDANAHSAISTSSRTVLIIYNLRLRCTEPQVII